MRNHRKALISLFLAALLFLTACGKVSLPSLPTAKQATEQEAVVESVAEPAQEAEPTPEPEPVPETPESRAAALGLPAPPDIDISSWEFALANYYNSINEYELKNYGGFEGQGFDVRAVEDLYAFIHAGRDAGYHIYAGAAYRNLEWCLNHYAQKVRDLGSAAAAASAENSVVHGTGVNEHQTGLAVDFTEMAMIGLTYSDYTNDGFEETESFAWLYEHCAEYGFIYRYPADKVFYYGVDCVEGHFRYVGKEAAKYIMENNLCLEEFLLLYDDEAVYQPDLWEAAGKH